MMMVVVVMQIPQGKSKDGAFLHLIFFCREALGNGTTVFAQRFWF